MTQTDKTPRLLCWQSIIIYDSFQRYVGHLSNDKIWLGTTVISTYHFMIGMAGLINLFAGNSFCLGPPSIIHDIQYSLPLEWNLFWWTWCSNCIMWRNWCTLAQTHHISFFLQGQITNGQWSIWFYSIELNLSWYSFFGVSWCCSWGGKLLLFQAVWMFWKIYHLIFWILCSWRKG